MCVFFWIISPILFVLAHYIGPIYEIRFDQGILLTVICFYVLTYVIIYCLMQKYHRFEFETSRRSMNLLFVFMMIHFLVKLFFFFSTHNNNKNFLLPELCTIDLFDETELKRKQLNGILQYSVIRSSFLEFFLVFIFLYIKS